MKGSPSATSPSSGSLSFLLFVPYPHPPPRYQSHFSTAMQTEKLGSSRKTVVSKVEEVAEHCGDS